MESDTSSMPDEVRPRVRRRPLTVESLGSGETFHRLSANGRPRAVGPTRGTMQRWDGGKGGDRVNIGRGVRQH